LALALGRAWVTSVTAGMVPEGGALSPSVDEVTGWLCALLRDVLCGHLDSDLRSVAEDIIGQDAAGAEQATLA
jgi:hypothetical protein